MSQNVIVGGDFRRLLNALSHVDEATLAETLPFRVGTGGLHLPEALVQASRTPVPAARVNQAIEWFKDEFAAMQNDLKSGKSLQRCLQVLGNADAEKRAADMLAVHLKGGGPAGGKKSGLFGSLGRIFGK
jgi:hypothetical protein